MNSKERVLTTFAREAADRVPINYEANPGINNKLMRHFKLKPGERSKLLDILGVDFRGVGAPYTGKKLHADDPERNVRTNDWGIRTTYIEHESGGYWDYCDFLLRDADEEMVANWAMPSPDDFDYSNVAAACENNPYALYVGNAGLACIINTAGFFRSMDQVFCDLALDNPAGLLLIDRFLSIQLECTRRTLEAAKGGVDFMWMGEDLGTQKSPLISMEMFKKHILPRQQPFLDLAKAYDLPVMLHTCGSSSWSYDEYAKAGVNVVDTLQPEAADMSPEYLKKTFADKLAFHGCISTAGPVAYGSVDDVIANCRETLNIMMPGGGYCFAPTHCLQDNSPLENVLAMYETAHKYGKY